MDWNSFCLVYDKPNCRVSIIVNGVRIETSLEKKRVLCNITVVPGIFVFNCRLFTDLQIVEHCGAEEITLPVPMETFKFGGWEGYHARKNITEAFENI